MVVERSGVAIPHCDDVLDDGGDRDDGHCDDDRRDDDLVLT